MEPALPQFESAKVIVKDFGKVRAFAVNTHQGIVRSYNEDRVSILLNAQQRFESLVHKNINSCSLFALYDGHGGAECCNFLKEKLHAGLLSQFDPADYQNTLSQGCLDLDDEFLKRAGDVHSCDTSGSCALVLLVVDNQLLFVNVGDSRAILSRKRGQELTICSYDHKPQFFGEMQRIFKYGGQLYRVCNNKVTMETEIYHATTHSDFAQIDRIPEESDERIFGPWRVKPGGLSVSRTFGDIESKSRDFGGAPLIVTAEPEITAFSITPDLDYVLLGCDGIFDALTNEEVNQTIWETISFFRDLRPRSENTYQTCLNECVNNILKRSLIQHSEDNVTIILVVFRNLCFSNLPVNIFKSSTHRTFSNRGDERSHRN